MDEAVEVRLRRMRMRSWRRGIKEMDLILGGFADAELARLDPQELEAYDLLLSENDHDLYAWVAGNASPPERFGPLLERIRLHLGAG